MLATDWNELIWSALTIGRPSRFRFLDQEESALHEAIFRVAAVKMALEQGQLGRFYRTEAFASLDPSEKGMISYLLGMTLCKLFASRCLDTPWLLHLDAFRRTAPVHLLGRSRPDLVGEDSKGRWHVFESKGRASLPSQPDRDTAKLQTQKVRSVSGLQPTLRVATFAFFKSNELRFYWEDPDGVSTESIDITSPNVEWQDYYRSVLSLFNAVNNPETSVLLRQLDLKIHIHPKILLPLQSGEWATAQLWAKSHIDHLTSEGYQPDGVKVVAGSSWMLPRTDEGLGA